MHDLNAYEYTEHHVYTHHDPPHLLIEPLEFTASLRRLRSIPCIIHRITPSSPVTHRQHVTDGYEDKPEMLLYKKGLPMPIQAQEVLSHNERGLWSSSIGQQQTADALARFLADICLPRSPRVVDLGVGDGNNFARILGRVDHESASGLDYHISKDYALGHPVFSTDLNKEFPLATGSVDLLSAICTIGILANPLHGINEAVRVVRPQGYLLVVERNLHTDYFTRNADALGVRIAHARTIDATVPEGELPSPEHQVEAMMADFPELDTLVQSGRATRAEIEAAKHDLIAAIRSRNEPRRYLPYRLSHYCALVQKK